MASRKILIPHIWYGILKIDLVQGTHSGIITIVEISDCGRVTAVEQDAFIILSGKDASDFRFMKASVTCQV